MNSITASPKNSNRSLWFKGDCSAFFDPCFDIISINVLNPEMEKHSLLFLTAAKNWITDGMPLADNSLSKMSSIICKNEIWGTNLFFCC